VSARTLGEEGGNEEEEAKIERAVLRRTRIGG